MQQKTNTVRIEPFEHVPQVANEDFLPALTLAYAREPAPHFDIRSYDPVTPRERLIILAPAVAASLAVLAGTLALMVV
jgi:hypothetical protein